MFNDKLSNEIQMKLIEILRTIFNLHLNRCESIEQFPFMELISALYKFTFQQVRRKETIENDHFRFDYF